MQTSGKNQVHDLDTLSLESFDSVSSFKSVEFVKMNMASDEPGKSLSLGSSNKPYDPPSGRSLPSTSTLLSIHDLCFLQRLGSGDIGTLYLVELRGNKGCMFAAKVMDKAELASRSKESRAIIEREILEMLDHPFLPTLYATVDTPGWSCLITDFCPGGDLHVLRQSQPDKRFDEAAVRFYAAEVVVALEYLHMMGIIYRDLKPENVLVRSDGHIMLTDFDLSLKCEDDSPNTTTTSLQPNNLTKGTPSLFCKSSCILPRCTILPKVSCFHSKFRRRRRLRPSNLIAAALAVVAEPSDARSMSFVGTHEYLAPEIVSGGVHGSAVDWWTLGVFIYELFYGVTPFKGTENEFTLANILARSVEFPKRPSEVHSEAKDLIFQLLVKDPSKRMGSSLGATAIKNHPFFDGVNWALLRCITPPYTPRPFSTYKDFVLAYAHTDEYDHVSSTEYY